MYQIRTDYRHFRTEMARLNDAIVGNGFTALPCHDCARGILHDLGFVIRYANALIISEPTQRAVNHARQRMWQANNELRPWHTIQGISTMPCITALLTALQHPNVKPSDVMKAISTPPS